MHRAMPMIAACLLVGACESSSTSARVDTPETTSDGLVDAELDTVQSWLASGGTSATPRLAAPETGPAPATLPPVEDMIHGLEQRLRNQPDDRKGWSLLARSYAHVGRMGDARRAAEHAVLLGDDPASLESQINAAHEGAL